MYVYYRLCVGKINYCCLCILLVFSNCALTKKLFLVWHNFRVPKHKSQCTYFVIYISLILQWFPNLEHHTVTHKSLVWYHVGAVWGRTLEVSAFSLSTWRHTYTSLWSVHVWIHNRRTIKICSMQFWSILIPRPPPFLFFGLHLV